MTVTVPVTAVDDVEWLSMIKGEVRPKRKAKRQGARADSRMPVRTGDFKGDLEGRPGKTKNSTPNRADSERAAANSTLVKANLRLMDIDSNPPADEGEGGELERRCTSLRTRGIAPNQKMRTEGARRHRHQR